MKIFLKTVITFLITSCATSHAVLIGHFPGLDNAIKQADSIAIIRIEEHIQPEKNLHLITRHRCMVYQTLKGDLKPDQRLPLDLMDTRTSFVSPFPLGSTHLVFLKQTGTNYGNLHVEGSILRLSPFGNEKLPEGDSTKAKIKILIERSAKYWDGEWKKEQEFLESITK